MKFYQLIFLGDTTCEACGKVKEWFFELLTERGLDKGMVAVLDGTLTLTAKEAGGYDSAKPTFAFYFGRQGDGDKDVDALQKLMGNGDAVLVKHILIKPECYVRLVIGVCRVAGPELFMVFWIRLGEWICKEYGDGWG